MPPGARQVVAQHVGSTKARTHQHRIVGVHIIGAGANDLIQMGALLVHTKSTLETVANTPFAAVTLTQLFQLATDNALARSPYHQEAATRRREGQDTDAGPRGSTVKL